MLDDVMEIETPLFSRIIIFRHNLSINVTFFNNSIILSKHYYVDTTLNINVTFLTTSNINV